MSFADPGGTTASRSFQEAVYYLDASFQTLFEPLGMRTDKHGREHEVFRLTTSTRPRSTPPCRASAWAGGARLPSRHRPSRAREACRHWAGRCGSVSSPAPSPSCRGTASWSLRSRRGRAPRPQAPPAATPAAPIPAPRRGVAGTERVDRGTPGIRARPRADRAGPGARDAPPRRIGAPRPMRPAARQPSRGGRAEERDGGSAGTRAAQGEPPRR